MLTEVVRTVDHTRKHLTYRNVFGIKHVELLREKIAGILRIV